MAFVKKFEFEHLSSTHLERLQRIHEELEREIALRHSIDNGQTMSFKDYWRVGSRQKKLLRYGADAHE